MNNSYLPDLEKRLEELSQEAETFEQHTLRLDVNKLPADQKYTLKVKSKALENGESDWSKGVEFEV